MIELTIFLSQDITKVGVLTPSDVDRIYKSDTFKSWKQLRDHELKIPDIQVRRLDNIAKAISQLPKAMSPR